MEKPYKEFFGYFGYLDYGKVIYSLFQILKENKNNIELREYFYLHREPLSNLIHELYDYEQSLNKGNFNVKDGLPPEFLCDVQNLLVVGAEDWCSILQKSDSNRLSVLMRKLLACYLFYSTEIEQPYYFIITKFLKTKRCVFNLSNLLARLKKFWLFKIISFLVAISGIVGTFYLIKGWFSL